MRGMVVYRVVAMIWFCLFAISVDAVDLSKDATDPVSETQVTNEAMARLSGTVFGEWMFHGEFANQSFTGFNPNYQIGIGDRINIQLWGGVEFQAILDVDAQGNLFVPKVGPVPVLNILNKDLNERIEKYIKNIYQRNVGVYATLETAQPVKIYVTGYVVKPGLFAGLSSDSVLHYLDKAGGILPRKGSFIDIKVLRNNKEVQNINLYEFLITGTLEPLQLLDGDTILVAPRKYRISVSGLVQNPFVFEFRQDKVKIEEVLKFARVEPTATHLRINRNHGDSLNVDYYPLDSISGVYVNSGDNVILTADKKVATISVRVEGEHDSPQEYILPHGATLGELLQKIQSNKYSDVASIQLFRNSVRERQRQMLNSSLEALEASVLTARSETQGEASLRTQEAKLLLQWVERAKTVQPKGQVILAGSDRQDHIVLEPNDIIRFPSKSELVMVHGEVLSANAVAYSSKRKIIDYIEMAGGFTQNEDNSKVMVLHPDGTFSHVPTKRLDDKYVNPGDEILVLPKIDVKSVQVTKDVVQLIYQIAISAGVVLAI